MDPSVDKSRFAAVHFAFDSFAISGAEAANVHEVAEFLKHGGAIIAGFTDERGTADYNRALGEKTRRGGARGAHRRRRGREQGADGELRRGNARRSRVERKRLVAGFTE